jgi:PhnB protein
MISRIGHRREGVEVHERPGATMSFHPYLAFAGNCRDAFTRYQEIFGGELVVLTGADVPAEAAGEMSPDMGDMVLHAALVSGDQLLMGADAPGGTFDGQNRGMCCNFSVDDLAEAERVFAALSDGGEVQMPLTPTFFSPGFAMCVDRFGTPWMVVTNDPNAAMP